MTRATALFSCILFFVFTGPVSVRAQQQVAGRVTGLDGQPLPGADIILQTRAGERQRYGAASDSTGHFEIFGIESGVYVLVVHYLGYATSRQVLDLRSDGRMDLRVFMVEKALPQSEVVVSARRVRRRLQPVTVSNITASELRRMPEMKDLPVLLARRPSITHYSENGNGIGYSTLRMRGFGQRRLAIAINGIPQNDPEEFNVFWVNFFDIQGTTTDIQIQRGAGSAMYGPAAIGGAINIIARPYRPKPFVRLEIGRGSFNTRRYTIEANSGLQGGRYIVFARLSHLLSDGYRDGSWTRFWRFFAGITRYGRRSTLTLEAYGGPQRDGLAFSGIPKAANRSSIPDGFGGEIDRRYNFSAATGDQENFHQPHVELHHDLTLSDRVRLSQDVFWIQGKGYFDFGGTFRSAAYLRLPDGFVAEESRDAPLYTVRPDIQLMFRAFLDQWQIGWLPRVTWTRDGLEVSAGAELRLHRSLRWGRIQTAVGIPESLVGAENDVRVYSFRGEKAIGSSYVSTLYRPTSRWAVQGDLQLTYRRYRIYDERFFGSRFSVPYTFLNPRIGVTYNPEHAVSVYASVSVSNREPRLKSLYDGEEAGAGFEPAFRRRTDGTFDTKHPVVRAERLVDTELGIRIERSTSRLSANLFLMDFRNEIVPSGGLDQFGVPRTGNAKQTRHVGLELEGALQLADGFRVSGTYTLSRNRFRSFEEYAFLPDFSTVRLSRKNLPIAGFPDASGNFSLGYTRGGLDADLHMSFVGKQFVDNGAGRMADGSLSDDLVIDAFHLMDLSIRYSMPTRSDFAGLRFGFDVNNVLDGRVLAFGNAGAAGPQFFPEATRHVYFSATYTLR